LFPPSITVAPCAAFYCGTSLWLKEPYVLRAAAKIDAFNEDASQHRIVDRSCAGHFQNPL
jgi:hypothetical protein